MRTESKYMGTLLGCLAEVSDDGKLGVYGKIPLMEMWSTIDIGDLSSIGRVWALASRP